MLPKLMFLIEYPPLSDVHSLHFAENTFDLVLAMGVLPYLHSPAAAIREMARVARPGSHLIITSDNYWRLNHILDPYWSPPLEPLRYLARKVLNLVGPCSRKTRRAGRPTPVYMYSMKELRALANSARLEECKVVTVGFGPFTFLGKKILPDSVGVWLNERLEELAERNLLGLNRVGSQHILLARKELHEPTKKGKHRKQE